MGVRVAEGLLGATVVGPAIGAEVINVGIAADGETVEEGEGRSVGKAVGNCVGHSVVEMSTGKWVGWRH